MAITTFSGNISLAVKYDAKKAVTSLNPVLDPQSFSSQVAYTAAGAGAGQANQVYCEVLTISSSSSTTIDLAGSVTNHLNETITFVRIKAVVIELLTTTTATSITIGNATNAWVGPFGAANDTVTVRNGGFFAIACADATGYGTITAGSADELKIANNDGTNAATVRVTIIGATS